MECIMRAQTQMVSVDTTAYYATPEREPGQLVASYERALQMAKCPVRALLLCNPHNPRGQLYSATELRALINFCHTHRLHLVSDEIYGVSTFGPPSMTSPTSRMYPSATDTFTPVMSLHQPDPSRVHTLHGISKDFGSSGLRLVRPLGDFFNKEPR
jgi:aspartate/methionine/tyrosine aminotransferase